jgi:hypothetical protein
MSAQYVQLNSPRFVVETVDGYEQIVVAAQRNIFLMLFLGVWLCAWTVGGATAMTTLSAKGFQTFLLFWLCGWALGEAAAGATLGWGRLIVERLRKRLPPTATERRPR